MCIFAHENTVAAFDRSQLNIAHCILQNNEECKSVFTEKQ